jgi:F-type H+-transporting ATPase subunit b
LISIKLSTKLLNRNFLLRACLPVLFLALSFGAVATPVALHAQATSLAAADQPAIGVPTPKSEPKPEADEVTAYRHSATVQWFAKLLNVDVEVAAKTFEYINFAVILLAVGIPLFRFLPKVFRQRSARLGAELEVAQAKTADANARLSAVEARMAGLDAEISAIRKQVDEDMRGDEARNKAAIEEETARIVTAAEQEIVMAGSQAQRGLRQFAANLAIDRALSTLTLDAETDRALIAEFALDVAKSGGSRKHSSKGDKN